KYFAHYRDRLSEDSRRRLDTNPLRILDSKHSDDIAIAANAPAYDEFLNAASQDHFKFVSDALAGLGIPFTVDRRLVRGLDYYQHTVWEVVCASELLGRSQATVLAGGRYDGLSKLLGSSQSLPGIGWASGIERLALLLPDWRVSQPPAPIPVLMIPDQGTENGGSRERRASNAVYMYALRVAQLIRQSCSAYVVHSQAAAHQPLGKQLAAVLAKAPLPARVAIVGSDELEHGQVVVPRSIQGYRGYSTPAAQAADPSPASDPKGEGAQGKKERPPGTYVIWAMEAIGATAAFMYYLHLYTDLLKPKVEERLNPDKYTPFTLVEREPLTGDTTRFRFRINRPRFNEELEQLADGIIAQGAWALDVKDHLVQTYRTYTPVNYVVATEVDDERGLREGYCDLVVKRYPGGSLSRFLHNTQVGDRVEMRGPILTWPYSPNKYRRLYMVAGGTGIAPMYQLIDRILGDPADLATQVSLLYGSQSEADIIYREQLDELAKRHPERLSIKYLVDRGPASAAQPGRPDARSVGEFVGGFDKSKDVVLVCGPDPMMAAVSGMRPIGPAQGPLRGCLRDLGLAPENVFKF
ncbi:hypothetical protein LPJ70_004755, partial [Coemansia sp. RSA 2708]